MMELDVMVDPIEERCCLVDLDSGRAFGPVFTGEDCLAQLDLWRTLVGEPLSMTPGPDWAVAERAVHAMLDEDQVAAPAAPEPVVPQVEVRPDGGTVMPSPATSPEITPDPPAAPADSDSDLPAPDPMASSGPTPGPDSPGGSTPIPTERPYDAVDCWSCKGTGREPDSPSGELCGICDGVGYLVPTRS